MSCRYDGLTQGEVEPHLEELLELVMWLTTCGRSELKVFDSVTYPQLEGFKFHHEASGGSSCISKYLDGQSGVLDRALCVSDSFAPVNDVAWSDTSLTFRDMTQTCRY